MGEPGEGRQLLGLIPNPVVPGSYINPLPPNPLQVPTLMSIKDSFTLNTSSTVSPFSTWVPGTPCQPPNWQGVFCDPDNDNSVVSLNFTEYQVSNTSRNQYSLGVLAPEFGNLTTLTSIVINGGQRCGRSSQDPSLPGAPNVLNSLVYLYGGLPDALGNLESLRHLEISSPCRLRAQPFELEGALPSSLSSLQNLTFLSLHHNQFSGPIPSWLLSMPALEHLDLSYNFFNSSIPTSFSQACNLTTLDLTTNFLTDGLPPEMSACSALSRLAVARNGLSGSFPEVVTELTSLSHLFLSYNQFMGTLPAGLSQLSSMRYLFLQGLPLSGPFPELGGFTNLDILWISFVEGTRSLPASLQYLTALDELSVSSSSLVGGIPPQICSLTQLSKLLLGDNQLAGAIPSCIGNLSNLINLNLGANALSGFLPASLSSLTALMSLSLQDNTLTGPLPNFALINNLNSLDMSGNQFSGPIPTSLSLSQSLNTLILGGNQLTGGIPPQLLTVTSLWTLALFSNPLGGSIPRELSNLTALQFLDLSNCSLTGQVPNLEVMDDLLFLDLSQNNLTGVLPKGSFNALATLKMTHNKLAEDFQNFTKFLTAPELSAIVLDFNNVSGALPDFSQFPNITVVSVSQNDVDAGTPQVANQNNDAIIYVLYGNPWCSGDNGRFTPACQAPNPELQRRFIPLNTTWASLAPSPTCPRGCPWGSAFPVSGMFPAQVAQDPCFCAPAFPVALFLPEFPYYKFTQQLMRQFLDQFAQYVDETFQNGFVSNQSWATQASPGLTPGDQLVNLTVFPVSLSPPALNSFLRLQDQLLSVAQAGGANTNWQPQLQNFGRFAVEPPSTGVFPSPAPQAAPPPAPEGSQEGKGPPQPPGLPPWVIVIIVVAALALLATIVLLGFFILQRRKASRAILPNAAADGAPGPSPGMPGSGSGSGATDSTSAASVFLATSGSSTTALLSSSKNQSDSTQSIPDDFTVKSSRAMLFTEVLLATDNFAEARVVGEGAYGTVYRGSAPDGSLWAVKRSRVVSERSLQYFRKEVHIISQIHHRNVVRLLGYCVNEGEQILVYEFVPKGTLKQHLHPKDGDPRPPLSFSARVDIALGSAQALQYLHSFSTPAIIHRDVKSDNILLTDSLQAKVSDFGLLKDMAPELEQSGNQGPHSSGAWAQAQGITSMSRVAGTPGYLDPEYYRTFKATTKSDVFSYGVVLLELITGRPSTFQEPPTPDHPDEEPAVVSLSEWALDKVANSNDNANANDEQEDDQLLREFADPRLGDQYHPRAMRLLIDLAAHCVRLMGKNRPDMGDVVRRLQEVKDLVIGRDPSQAADVSIREEEEAVFGSMTVPAAWLLRSQGNSSTIESGTVDSSPASMDVQEHKPMEG